MMAGMTGADQLNIFAPVNLGLPEGTKDYQSSALRQASLLLRLCHPKVEPAYWNRSMR